MPGLLDVLLRNESGGRNIANTTSGTDSGQAQGYFQITTGTWNEFAPKVGIDLSRYPTPMRAADGTPVPYDVQARVANVIPLKRWAPSTIALMKATGKAVDTDKMLGENLSANGENIFRTTGATSTSTAPVYTTLTPAAAADASAFAYLNNNNLYEEAEDVVPSPQHSPLADTLADSVDTTSSSQRHSSEPLGYNDLLGVPEGGAGDTLPPSALASQPGSEVQAPPAITPSTDESLADLFKVKPIGQAAMVDPRTGAPLLNRYRALG